MEKQSFCTHSNAEVVSFDRKYKSVFFDAFTKAGLRRCDWETVENILLEKYADGRIEYDPTGKAKPTTYYFVVARNCAIDELRKQRFVELDDKEMSEIRDEHNSLALIDDKDERRFVEEAFRRFVAECRDKQKALILLRYVVNGEERARLAEELDMSNDLVSLVKNRWLPRLQKLLREILREDEEGRLRFSNIDIGFLKPYMRNW